MFTMTSIGSGKGRRMGQSAGVGKGAGAYTSAGKIGSDYRAMSRGRRQVQGQWKDVRAAAGGRERCRVCEQEYGQVAVPVSVGLDRQMDSDIEIGQRQWQVQWSWSGSSE